MHCSAIQLNVFNLKNVLRSVLSLAISGTLARFLYNLPLGLLSLRTVLVLVFLVYFSDKSATECTLGSGCVIANLCYRFEHPRRNIALSRLVAI
jgi:hypothetical protein